MASSRDTFFDREAFVEDELSMFAASPERNNDEEPEGNEEAEGKGKGKGKSAEGKGWDVVVVHGVTMYTEPYLGKGKSAEGKGCEVFVVLRHIRDLERAGIVQPGDMLSCGDHTEPYLGKGKSAGGKGKSRGKESARSGPYQFRNTVEPEDLFPGSDDNEEAEGNTDEE